MKTERKLITITTMLGAFWVPLIVTSANVALPTIGREFNAAPAALSWVISAMLLTIAMTVLPIGRISDLYGRKKVLSIGALILSFSSLLCATANSIVFLIIFRALQGLGGAMVTTTVVSIVTAAFPAGERGKALGINVAATYVGLSAGPFISGLIVDNFHWRGIFYLFVPIGLVLFFLTTRIKQEWKTSAEKVDIVGALIYAVAIFALVWGLSNLNSTAYAGWILIGGVLVLILFGLFESRSSSPLLDVRTLKSNRMLIFSSLTAFINYSSTFAISYLMSLYLQDVRGISAQYAGFILLIQPIFQAVFSPLSGVISDRAEPRYVASLGMTLITISLFFLSFLGTNSPILAVVILLGTIGIGYALFSPPNANSIMSSVEPKQYGVASGILSTARTVGQSFSMAITTLISSFYLGQETISAQTADLFVRGFQKTFLLFSILCLLGVLTSLARGKRGSIRQDPMQE
ncbi:MAG: MFS transporter [Firmicutes bacterium]|nr:MFS transporter [Bacillota bacterium]